VHDYATPMAHKYTNSTTCQVSTIGPNRNAIGIAIPFSQVAQLQFESLPSTIKHLNKKRLVVITAFTNKGALAEQVTKEFLKNAAQLTLPVDIATRSRIDRSTNFLYVVFKSRDTGNL